MNDSMATVGESPLAVPEDLRSPLAIVCGSGQLPFTVADAVLRRGRAVLLLAFKGWADPQCVARYPHHWIAVGQFGTGWRLAHEAGCRDVVCIGGLLRPTVRTLRLDWTTVKLLPRLYRLFRGGDDHLLSGLGRLFEENGFRMLGAHEVAPEILIPEGPLGRYHPSERDRADIARGLALIEAIGAFDIGQAAVVADGRVLAIEAAEGTDAMLARIAELRRAGRVGTPVGTGVLVKAPKPAQDRRFDMPSIGPATIEAVKHAGLAGIGVRADEVIAAELEALVGGADRARLFVTGVASGPVRPR
jgi:UDP-2,3-diacylglucosamine hydrolase